MMKKATVSYQGFRFSKLNDPRFSHLKLLLFWPPCLILFFITGHLIPQASCTPMHMWLDDVIPFCEWFLIPYVFWYLLVAFTLLYFLRYDVDCFKRLQTYIAIAQLVSTVVYIVWPTCHELRPDFAALGRDNLLIDGVKLLYSVDTTQNACPSLHVSLAIGIAIEWCRYKGSSRLWKVLMILTALLICMSTAFVKQHSAVDFFGALPLVLVAQIAVSLIYRKKVGEAVQ